MSNHPFRRAVEAGEFDRVGSLFAPDAVLHKLSGVGTGDHALMFRAAVANLEIQGCDFLHTRGDGLIDEITVMVRPLRAATVFAERMRAALGG
ncbi:hypothetical protein A5709_11460 [Mycobacterium sp. E1386]|uniref:hypothetical protein n=1 Tax=Mycobacterium sp. E1386 TaxID=1834126 RepID=UPI0007FCB688|nr:hypothetical protein [Mycobacterium sp. E1386]OBI39276.1 hypothetical protein A5709_11460 [Mycobacterium sp. E1386]